MPKAEGISVSVLVAEAFGIPLLSFPAPVAGDSRELASSKDNAMARLRSSSSSSLSSRITLFCCSLSESPVKSTMLDSADLLPGCRCNGWSCKDAAMAALSSGSESSASIAVTRRATQSGDQTVIALFLTELKWNTRATVGRRKIINGRLFPFGGSEEIVQQAVRGSRKPMR
ncbi:hypothetical protein VTN31DRAFT_6922 [Thermomyces dupontii]|uniref:uncharacterized protein n=1 Tax=Talaromyces thermophilus TaxID=28565 RepID=UPI003741F225